MAILVTGGVAAGADSLFIEPNRPVLNRVTVPLRRLPEEFDGFTIAQLSDFHYDEHFSAVPIRTAVEIVNSLNPHLVVLTGDFVTEPFLGHRLHRNLKKAAEAAEPCGALLSKLKAEFGVMTVIGNHDGNTDPDRVKAILRSQGLPVMYDESHPLERGGKKLWIAGLDDNPDETDLIAALKKVPSDEAVVVLIHEPDTADFVSKYPVDLQLSGHSHGGQVRLPLIGAPYLPRLARKYPRGLRKVGGLTLYTNIGIGTIGVPVRLNCPPEVTLFTLRSVSA
ncbi:MAG TPA: metallophosphoesterase [Terriglobales bacterium]|nr:metallophosphoesterase [Terriglobales bacterium]